MAAGMRQANLVEAMQTIRKAVITAAGRDQRSLVLQRFIDRGGSPRTALGILLADAAEAGCEEVAVVVAAGGEGLYQIERVVEKPSPTLAEQVLVVPGLRAGWYLCFFGLHVLTPAVFEILAEHGAGLEAGARLALSPALAALAARERYLAYEVQGRRYDLGAPYGMLTAQLALALAGRDREEVLAQLVELLATRGG